MKRRSNNHKHKSRFSKDSNSNEPRRKRPKSTGDRRAAKYGVPTLLDEEGNERSNKY